MSEQVVMLQQKLLQQIFTAESSTREVALLRDQLASMTSSLAAAQVNNQHMSMILEVSNSKAQMLLNEKVRLQTMLSQMSSELAATRNHRDDALEQLLNEQGKNKALSAKLSVVYASKSQPPVQPVELAPPTEVSIPVQEQPVSQVEAQVVQVQVQVQEPEPVQVQEPEPAPAQVQEPEPEPEQVQEPTPDNAFFESIIHSTLENAVSKADFKAHKAELAAKREAGKAARAAKHEADQAELAAKREKREAEQAAKAAEKLQIQEQQAKNLAYKARRRAETQDIEDKIKARKAEEDAKLEAKKKQDLKDHRARVAEAKKAETLRRKGLTGQSKPQLDADKTEVTKEQAARALREQQALIAEAIQKCSPKSPKPASKKAGVLADILDSELGLKGSAMHGEFMDTPETYDALSDHVVRKNVTGPPAIPSGAVFESGIYDLAGIAPISGRSYKKRGEGQAPCSPCELLQYRIVSLFGLKSFVITESRGWGWRLKCMFEELGGPEKHFFTLATMNFATISSWIDNADFQKLCKRFAVGMTERAKVLTGDAFNVQRETIKKYLALILPEMKRYHPLMEVVELEELDLFGLPLVRVSAGLPPRTDRISMWDLVDWYENGTFDNIYTYPDSPVI